MNFFMYVHNVYYPYSLAYSLINSHDKSCVIERITIAHVPDKLTTSMSGKSSCRYSSTFWTPFDTMFIPMASPVEQLKRIYILRPAKAHWMYCSRANRLDLDDVANSQTSVYIVTSKYKYYMKCTKRIYLISIENFQKNDCTSPM